MTFTHQAARPTVLAIQNDPSDPPLLVGEWLMEAGLDIVVVEAFRGEAVPTEVPDSVSGILAMGGSMGVHDHHEAPWLRDEMSLLADATDKAVPVLGLCLGSQLLATALGGTVELAPQQEIGLSYVWPTDDGLADPVISSAVFLADRSLPAAQWHQDHVTCLPQGSRLLLTNDACTVQGFRVGESYGLQLHPELNGQLFRGWADYVDDALRRSGIDPLVAADEVEAMDDGLMSAWRPVAHAWARLAHVQAERGGLVS